MGEKAGGEGSLPVFCSLVQQNSRFWNAGGIKAEISLFGGERVSAEILKSLLVGGIAFATPSPPGPAPKERQVFTLYEKPEDKWLKWSPLIQIGSPTDGSQPEDGIDMNKMEGEL